MKRKTSMKHKAPKHVPLRQIAKLDVVGLLAYLETELLHAQDLYDSLAGSTPHEDSCGRARMLGKAEGCADSRRVIMALRRALRADRH